LLPLAGATLLCGCDKQAKINGEKIQILSQNVVQFEQGQARQMAAIQSQLTSLAPMLDRMNNSYFEKNHDDALFYHTNTLYLLLIVDKKIEAHLELADTRREAESSLAYSYHTNELDLMQFCAAQIQGAMTVQESRVEDKVNAETRRVGANVIDELRKQIKLSAPDAEEIARRGEMEADVVQIKRELDQIKAQLGQITNQPAARPSF
jgi:hypothetical protein